MERVKTEYDQSILITVDDTVLIKLTETLCACLSFFLLLFLLTFHSESTQKNCIFIQNAIPSTTIQLQDPFPMPSAVPDDPFY